MNKDLQEQIRELPEGPGVYRFEDDAGQVLYIGKAFSLKSRVKSYLSPSLGKERGKQFEEMVKRVKKVEVVETGSEVEALMLEAKLIRQEKPYYNIRLRDDKSFAVIAIDHNLDFPQLSIKREADVERICAKLKRDRKSTIWQKIAKVEYFGPYPSSGSAKKALQTLRRAFRFRDCSPVKFRHYQKIGRGCLFASIKLCDAPCIGRLSILEYRRSIEKITQFLRGNQLQVIRDLERQMANLAKLERFEEAARIRNQLLALSKIQIQANLMAVRQPRISFSTKAESGSQQQTKRIECFDFSNISGDFAVGAMVVAFLRGGRSNRDHLSICHNLKIEFARQYYRRFKIRTVKSSDDIAMMKEVLARRLSHLGQTADWARPDLVFIDGGRAHLNIASRLFKALGNNFVSVPIVAIAKGRSRRKVDLYYEQDARIPIPASELPQIAAKMREEAHRFAIGYYRTLHRKMTVGEKTSK